MHSHTHTSSHVVLKQSKLIQLAKGHHRNRHRTVLNAAQHLATRTTLGKQPFNITSEFSEHRSKVISDYDCTLIKSSAVCVNITLLHSMTALRTRNYWKQIVVLTEGKDGEEISRHFSYTASVTGRPITTGCAKTGCT